MCVCLLLGHAGKHKDSASVTSDNAESIVQVQGVNKGSAVSTDGPSKVVLHATVFIHPFRKLGTHEQLNSQELGLFAKTVLGGMASELILPAVLVNRVVVGSNTTSSDPDGMTIRVFRIGKSVTVGRHDSLDGTNDILVGGFRVGSQSRLDGKGSQDAAEFEKNQRKRKVRNTDTDGILTTREMSTIIVTSLTCMCAGHCFQLPLLP